MTPNYCQMVKTDEEHATIKGLFKYRCSQPDCGRAFWSYNADIKIPCRHVRGTVEQLVDRVVGVFKPNRKQRRAAAKQRPAINKGPQPPGTAQKIWNLAKALADWVADPRSVSKEAYQARLEVCSTCTYRDDTKCKLCGCFLAAKAKAAAWHCPAFKWDGDIGLDQLLCVIPFTAASQRQDIVMLMQSAKPSTKITVLDCVGDYVAFADEAVVRAYSPLQGLGSLCLGTNYHAYAFMQPHVRGTQLLAGMLWAQQLSDAGLVMPVYSDTRRRITAENKKAGNFYWRNIPAVSPEMFLITRKAIAHGLPPAVSDLAWAMHLYSMDLRLNGIPVVEAWTCQQTQSPPPLRNPPDDVLRILRENFGPYWDMLHNDSRVRLPSAGTAG